MSLMDELTPKQKEALDVLKSRIVDEVNPEMKDDFYLYLRFLRARDFNVNLAEDMLRNHLAWRKANQIDNIITDFAPAKKNGQIESSAISEIKYESGSELRKSRIAVAIKYLPFTRIGFDKDGCPVRYFAFGNMDSKGILKSVKRNECIRGIIQCFEEDVAAMKEQSKKIGKPVQQWTYIFNFDGYTFAKATHKPTLETLIALFVQYEANYPERLKAAYIINASVYFSIAFSIIKPLLSGATLKKITIYGRDGWKNELLKTIDPEVLPAFLGGDRTDHDGNTMCNTIVKHGCLVPEEYYMTKSSNRLSSQPGVKKLSVARLSKVCIELNVEEAGSLIEWEFETENRDIGFVLLRKESNSNDCTPKELIPEQRIDTHMATEAGMYQCDRPGTYILVFDNTYSWFHSKEIYCKATVASPKGQQIYVLD
ncbi:SEC14-like protein 2 isoform X2 [Stegodyphus dumicola]|nr:SEC14-like protein 2 isoform X2 [Stegodyphus dumicola]